jgi:hypothetical protein
MKQLSLSLLITFLVLTSNLCLNIQPQSNQIRQVEEKNSGKKSEGKIDEKNNVYLHSIRFSAKLLKRLGDPRNVDEIKKEMIEICPTQNLIRTIRTDLINHLALVNMTDDNSEFTSDLPIQTFSTMIQHIVDACPKILNNSGAMTYISAALKNLKPKQEKILKLRKKTSRIINRLKEILNVEKSEVTEKVQQVNKEIKKEKDVAQAKIEHQDVIKILDKLEKNVKKIQLKSNVSNKVERKKNKNKSSENINFLNEEPSKAKKKHKKNKNKSKDKEKYNEYLDNDKDFSVFPPEPAPLKETSNKNKDLKINKRESSLTQHSAISFIEIENKGPNKKNSKKKLQSNNKKKSNKKKKSIEKKKSGKIKNSNNSKKGRKKSSDKEPKKVKRLSKVPLNTKHSRDLIRKSNFYEGKRQSLSSYFAKKIKYFAEKF